MCIRDRESTFAALGKRSMREMSAAAALSLIHIYQNEAVGHILERYLALVLLVLAHLLYVGVDGVDEGAAHGFFGRAAVLQPGAVVVVLDEIDLYREAERRRELDLVLGLVRPDVYKRQPLGLRLYILRRRAGA